MKCPPQGVRPCPTARDFRLRPQRRAAEGLGRPGLCRLSHPLPAEQRGYKDELIVFLGASYFRALGAGQQYGLSARGLAIDTAGGSGEEFPALHRVLAGAPAAERKSLTILALLDSPRATGAYRFDITPGSETVTRVRGRLFLRAGAASRSRRWAWRR